MHIKDRKESYQIAPNLNNSGVSNTSGDKAAFFANLSLGAKKNNLISGYLYQNKQGNGRSPLTQGLGRGVRREPTVEKKSSIVGTPSSMVGTPQSRPISRGHEFKYLSSWRNEISVGQANPLKSFKEHSFDSSKNIYKDAHERLETKEYNRVLNKDIQGMSNQKYRTSSFVFVSQGPSMQAELKPSDGSQHSPKNQNLTIDSVEQRRLSGFAHSKKMSEQWMAGVDQMRNPLKQGFKGSEQNIPLTTLVRKLTTSSHTEGAYAPIESIFYQDPNTASGNMLVINSQYYLDKGSKDQIVVSPD